MKIFPVRRRVRASHHTFVCAAALLLALPAHANDYAAALGLQAAADLAATDAPQVEASEYRVEAARQDAVRAGRLPDPRLVAGIDNLTATGPQAFDAGADMMTMRRIGLMQDIPAHAKRVALAGIARSDADIAEAEATTLRQVTRRAAAGAWVALWAAERERVLLGELRERATLAAKTSKARLAGGAGNASDALAMRAAAVLLDNRLDAADAESTAARAALRRWIGDAADRVLAPPPDFSTLPTSPAHLQADIDRQAPLLGWDERERKAAAALDLARAGKHPDWSVALSYGSRIDRSDMIGLEIGVSLPFFGGNRHDRDIGARHAELDAVEAEHEDARRAQLAAVEAAIANWQGFDKQARRYREQLLPLAHDRSRIALAAYGAGAPLQPWLDARRDEIDARIACASALAAWGTAWVELAYLLPDRDTPPELPR